MNFFPILKDHWNPDILDCHNLPPYFIKSVLVGRLCLILICLYNLFGIKDTIRPLLTEGKYLNTLILSSFPKTNHILTSFLMHNDTIYKIIFLNFIHVCRYHEWLFKLIRRLLPSKFSFHPPDINVWVCLVCIIIYFWGTVALIIVQ